MTIFEIPTLRTDRLILRAFRADDLDAYASMQADPEVMRYLGTGVTRTRAESWDAIARMLGQWALRGTGQWVIEEAATGAFVGRTGILHPYDWDGPEIAYALDRPFWRRGYATESTRAVHHWAYEVRGLTGLVSYIRPENDASKRVVARLGAIRGDDAELLGSVAEVWHHRPPA